MTRRRRMELYFAVAFVAASLSYVRSTGLMTSTGGIDPGAADPFAPVVFFLDEPVSTIATPIVRRAVNVVTATMWGVALGWLWSVFLIDEHDRWRLLGR